MTVVPGCKRGATATPVLQKGKWLASLSIVHTVSKKTVPQKVKFHLLGKLLLR